jgi:competence protein ComEA
MSRLPLPRHVVDPIGDDPDVTDPLGTRAVPDAPDVDPDPADVLARMRPAAARTWRERVDDVVDDLRRGRLGATPATLAVGGLAAVVLALVVIVAWQVMAAPAAAPEAEMPRATAPPGASPPGTAVVGDDPSAATAIPAAGPASPAPVVATPGAGATGEVVVHVVGAVKTPGVQRLPAGARVTDAVDAAGGATADADLARVNLAATVTDGAQIVVPRPGDAVVPVAPAPAVGAASPTAPGAPGGAGPIDVNTAGPTELEELPGVGPVTAAAIVAHRDEFGPFATVDALIDVRGIGEAKLEQLRTAATV